ncbi:MAG: pantoate--beta-alanine ligase [Bacteroidales bacterium]
MIIAKSLTEFQEAYKTLEYPKEIGLIPTMGALHEGHLSLIKKASTICKHTVVSVFVNPTQFNNSIDFDTYPRTVDNDCKFLEDAGVDIVFVPRVIDIYPQKDKRIFDLGQLDKYGEGPRRPGHFNGVAQVVTRLFDIVKPSKAFFGEKDFQQLAILQYVTKNLHYSLEIVRCPIARWKDGLAKSSRNKLLTPKQRKNAPHLFKCISKAKELYGKKSVGETIKTITDDINSNNLFETEYVEIINANTMAPITSWNEAEHIQLSCAVYMRPVRLIDNLKIK